MTVTYTTLERIAVGGMGEVFLARQEGMGGFRRTVVLKRLLPDVEGDDDSVRRFLDEARVAAALSHENVVSILEVGDDNGPYLALEYVHGENAGALRQKAKKKQIRFPIVVVARIVADAARGLHHAHDAKDVDGRPLRIVHRDVAPKNIFVRSDGLSKIGDFGIAKSASQLSKTATGQVPGTLSYMAPEQTAGDETSPASDQFSLGIVLWELLCGEPLFKAASPQETLRNTLTKPVSRPSKKRQDAEPLDAICLRMLDRDPTKRFKSLADVATAIEAAMPETRAELGQKAVAMFVETVSGDELRDRQERIEKGPSEDTVRLDREHPRIPWASSSSVASPGAERTPSGTPATISAQTDAATVQDRRLVGGGGSASGTPGTPLVVGDGAFGVPRTGVVVRRLLVAAALFSVVIAACVAIIAFVKPMSIAERTDQYVANALAVNPTLHREVFLAMTDIARMDPENDQAAAIAPDPQIEAIADRLTALLTQRLTDLRAHKSDGGYVGKARAILQGVGSEDLAADELEMWDYDSAAPINFLPPGSPKAIALDLKEQSVDFMHGQKQLREKTVARLLARAQLDDAKVKAVHAALDPLVLERERLAEEVAGLATNTGTTTELLLVKERRMVALVREGERVMKEVLGSPYGPAVAAVAFHTIASPDDPQPLMPMAPADAEAKAAGTASPQTH